MDVSIPGRGLSINIERTYGSRRENEFAFGYGWDMNYNLKVQRLDDPNTIVFLDGKGCTYEYTRDVSDPSKFIRSTKLNSYFEYDDVSDTFTLIKRTTGVEYAFDTNDNLSSITNENGNSITFDYDANGLSTITDDLGRQTSLSCNSDGLVETITDFADRTWTYTYNPDTNDLLGVTGPNTVDYPDGLTTTYYYDANHNLISITDPNDDEVVYNYYDDQDRVYRQDVGYGSWEFEHDPTTNTTTITDREGFVTKMVYSDSGQLLSHTVYTADPNSEPNSFTTTYVYDSNSLQRTRVVFPAGNCVDYTYDNSGRLTGIYRKTSPDDPNDPNVIATLYTYDPNFDSKVKTVRDPEDNVTTYTYDYGGALSFNGNDDYVDLDAHIGDYQDLTEGTISVWLKRASTTAGDMLISASDSGDVDSTMYIMIHGADDYADQFKVRIAQGGTSKLYWRSGGVTIDDTDWHHFVYTTDSSGNWKYLDGELVTGTYTAGSSSTNAFFDYVKDQDNLRIGHIYKNGSAYGHFNGAIDDIGIYDRALSESEIEALHNGEEISDGLVGYWKMDDNADNYEVVDSSGNNNHGTSSRYTSEMHTEGIGWGSMREITYPEVQTPDGNETPVESFKYNRYGQLTQVTAPDGIVTKYEYYDTDEPNGWGQLRKFIVDYNATDGLNITTEYKYDILGRLTEVTDPNGDVTYSEYNALDQLAKTIAPSPFEYVTKFSYDKNANQSKIEREIAGPNQITSFTYILQDKLQKITDPLGYVTKYGYNKNEDPNLITDAENNSTVSKYNERGLLWKVTDANGGVTEYSYDDNGNLKEIKDPNGNTTSYAYDGFNRLIKITYPDDTNEVFGYDKNSNITSKKNRKDQTIYYEYDALNQQIVKNRPADPNITYLYDIASRVVDVNDGGDVTEYYYDRIGRVSDVNDPESRLVSYKYDSRGLRTKLTYPDDSNVTYEYDALSRLTEIKYEGSVVAEYQYDELSRRILLTLGNDANAVYEYDLGNRLTNLTNNFNGAGSGNFDYTHDNVGNRLTMNVDDTDQHSYGYDNLYQLIDVNYPVNAIVTYSYDKLGNRTSVVNGGITSYLSNNLNQYTSIGENGNLVHMGETGNLAHWKMDDNDANTTVVDSSPIANDGTFIDPGGDPNTDAHHTAGKVTDGALAFDGVDDYIDCGNDPNVSFDASEKYTYSVWFKANETMSGTCPEIIADEDAGLTSGWDLYWLISQNTVYFWNNYTGKDELSTSTLQRGLWYHVVVTYDAGYAELYLDSQLLDSSSSTYADSTGKFIIGLYQGGPEYFTGEIDDVMIFDRVLTAEEIRLLYHLGYDKNGNLTSDGTYKYYYDCENRLIDVNDANDDPVASYAYDYLGRRVSRFTSHDSQTTIFTYDGDQVIAEYDGNDVLLRKFVYGPGIDEPICMLVPNVGIYYYHFDGLGSIVAITDPNGSFVETYEYDVYGETTIWDMNAMEIVDSSIVGNPYMFTGRRYDSETGLYYYRARYYSPYIGRFLQTDLTYYSDGLNLYTYCRNNPLNWVDPYGKRWYNPIDWGRWIWERIIRPIWESLKTCTGTGIPGEAPITCAKGSVCSFGRAKQLDIMCRAIEPDVSDAEFKEACEKISKIAEMAKCCGK